MPDTSLDTTVSTPKPRRRSKLERETTIVFNELEPDAVLWTASLKEVARWAKLELPIEPENGGWRTRVAKRRIRIGKARVTSPANSQAARERLAVARSRRGQTAAQGPESTNG